MATNAYLIVLAVSVFQLPKQSAYIISPNTSRWMDAYDFCSLAKPDVTSEGFVINQQVIDLGINEEAWVGYYQYNAVFDFLGCVRKNKDLVSVGAANSIRKCYPACDFSDVLGISEHHCYCLTNQMIISSNYTNSNNCPGNCDPDSVVCRGGDMSVYRLVPKVTPVNSTGPCLSIANGKDEWTHCSKLLQYTACGEQTSVIPTKNTTWLQAANACLVNGSQPTGHIARNPFSLYLDYWTGAFQISVMRSRSDNLSLENIKDKVQYGFMYNSNNNVRLSFSAPGDTTHKKLLCENDETSYSETRPSTGSQLSLFTTQNFQVENENGIPVNIGVLVAVAAVVIVVIAVIGGIYCKKRHKAPPEYKDDMTKKDDVVEDTYNYAQENPRTGVSYECVEPVPSGSHEEDDSENALLMSTYDVTVTFERKEKKPLNFVHNEDADVYNKLQTVSDDTYDQTNMSNKRPTEKIYGTQR